MNPHFSAEAPERSRPKGLCAQVDFIEPLGEGLALVGLDGVDAEWFAEFSEGHGLNKNTASVDVCKAFAQGAPLFHLQLTMFLDEANRRFRARTRHWLRIDLSAEGPLRGELYPTLFSPAQAVAFDAAPLPLMNRRSRQLNSLTLVPAQTPMPHAPPTPLHIEELAVLDVGQGSANALLCREGVARIYFDVGCGVSLLDTETLPADHFSVYRSITRHSSVELIAARRALHITRSALKKRDRMCSPPDFRKIVRGGGLIDVNGVGRGIPQGSPISALLSNLYMFEFDVRIATEVENRGGYYRRYCDDILIVADAKWSTDLEALVAAELQRIGLVMQISKTQMRKFSPAADKPLQYLGLTYDGDRILLRPSGIARHYSKMRRGILSHKLSPRLIKGRSLLQVRRRRLLRAYTEHAPATVRSFMSYVRSASKKSGSAVVLRQLKGHRRRFRKLLKS